MGRLRYLSAGESHGEMLVGILEGMPSGMSLISERDIDPPLAERQKGYGRGRRQQIEQDTARIVSGVRHGLTTGAPITLIIENKDWIHWKERMAVVPVEKVDASHRNVTIPRPGHADLAGGIKYGHEDDLRNVLERASARETAMRVAIGAIADKMLSDLGCESISYVTSIGGKQSVPITTSQAFELQSTIAVNAVRMPMSDEETEIIINAIDTARKNGDTLGGTVESIVRGVPIGIGSHVQWDRKLDGALAQAIMSVQAVKAVEIGAGVRAANSLGSEVHDSIVLANDKIARGRNNAGGIEGGMSNGEEIVVRAHMKPISTLMQPLGSVDLATGLETEAHIERSDVCAVPALAVIVRYVTSLTIANALLETFGGDTMNELVRRTGRRRDRLSIKR